MLLVPALAGVVDDFTTSSITGTSISTPTTEASAAPNSKANSEIATAQGS